MSVHFDPDWRANGHLDQAVEHIRAWEVEHGPLPDGGWLLYRTGWDARSEDSAAFLNANETGPHTPGISVECARWLAEETPIIGVGVETVGTDAGAAHGEPVLMAGRARQRRMEDARNLGPAGHPAGQFACRAILRGIAQRHARYPTDPRKSRSL